LLLPYFLVFFSLSCTVCIWLLVPCASLGFFTYAIRFVWNCQTFALCKEFLMVFCCTCIYSLESTLLLSFQQNHVVKILLIWLKTHPHQVRLLNIRYSSMLRACFNWEYKNLCTHNLLCQYFRSFYNVSPGTEEWTASECSSRDVDVDADRRRLEAFEMWIWRRMERSAGWVRLSMRKFWQRKLQRIGHVLRNDGLSHEIIKGGMRGKPLTRHSSHKEARLGYRYATKLQTSFEFAGSVQAPW